MRKSSQSAIEFLSTYGFVFLIIALVVADYYAEMAKSMAARKALGQHFLIDRRVALAEAAHAARKRVVELGPGLGILTEEMCKVATSLVAVEVGYAVYVFP